MKNLKKIKFSDIVGMLEIDEMREIIGGCGSGTGSNANYGFGGGGGAPALSGGGTGFGTSFSGSNYGGFGGSNAVGGGTYGSGSITGAGGSSFPGSPYYNGSAGSGTNNLNSSTSNASYNNGVGGWIFNNDGSRTTNDPTAISRYLGFLKATDGNLTNNEMYTFLNNEVSAAGREINTIMLQGIILGEVVLPNNYKGPSKIPKGMVYENGVLTLGNIMASNVILVSSGGNSALIYSSSSPTNVKPSAEFLASPFGEIYNKLTSENTNFLCLLDKFNNSKTFNLNYIYSSIGMSSPDNDAQTTHSLIVQGKTVIGANVNQQFNPNKIFGISVNGNTISTYERTEIGKVTDIIHEALHAYLSIKQISGGADHTVFNQYRSLLIDTLSEYNNDNNLGYTANQINELAFKGTYGSNSLAPSEQFSCYIQGLSEKNGTTYTEEFKSYLERVSNLNWNLISTKTN